MAKVVLGGGFFVLEAITSSVAASGDASLFSAGMLATSLLGAVPAAWQLAATFYGNPTAEIAPDPAEA